MGLPSCLEHAKNRMLPCVGRAKDAAYAACGVHSVVTRFSAFRSCACQAQDGPRSVSWRSCCRSLGLASRDTCESCVMPVWSRCARTGSFAVQPAPRAARRTRGMAGPPPLTLGGAHECPAHRSQPRKREEHDMTEETRTSPRITGTLHSKDGRGVVRMEGRYDTAIDDLWAALTEAPRLARWIAEV